MAFVIPTTCWAEGARTAADAERYLASYADALAAIGKSAGDTRLPSRPGISVKYR